MWISEWLHVSGKQNQIRLMLYNKKIHLSKFENIQSDVDIRSDFTKLHKCSIHAPPVTRHASIPARSMSCVAFSIVPVILCLIPFRLLGRGGYRHVLSHRLTRNMYFYKCTSYRFSGASHKCIPNLIFFNTACRSDPFALHKRLSSHTMSKSASQLAHFSWKWTLHTLAWMWLCIF